MKLGVFGGTYDPPHVGHLIVAQDARIHLGLDRVLFVPARIPPHKRSQMVTPAELRLEMLKAAVASDPYFEVDDLELRREGPSYTVDTLHELRRRMPEADLYLLLGADQFRDFGSWREAAEIPRLAKIAVLSRAGETPGDAVTRVPVTRIDISSSEIRRRAAAGLSIRHLVPDAVHEIIERAQLYRVVSPV